MISIYFKIIAAFIFCVISVTAQKSFLAEKTSRTRNDHVVQESANLRGIHATSKYDGMTAVTTALLSNIGRVPIDQSGRILTDGQEQFIVTVAGTGYSGFSGDNGPAISAKISRTFGIDFDGNGDVFFADTLNNRVRKVTVSTGNITTIAGTGTQGYNGDNRAAISALLSFPTSLAFDRVGDIYIAEYGSSRIRKVTVSTGLITTIAGNGIYGYNGDNRAATSAQLRSPFGVALDGMGNIYIADTYNFRIRKVTVSTGDITTIAGTGYPGYNGDNRAAANAQLRYPVDVALDRSGDVYIADYFNNRIRKVTVSTGNITTIAGTGTQGYNGDNRAAISALLSFPTSLAFDRVGDIYIAEYGSSRIRKVTVSTGNITTIAGNGIAGYNGDNRAATSAQLQNPSSVALDVSDNVYIADTDNYRIRLLTSVLPTSSPTSAPSVSPTTSPSAEPSAPTVSPTAVPSMSPTASPSAAPSMSPTACPSTAPSVSPTASPSVAVPVTYRTV